MDPRLSLAIVVVYFGLLYVISLITGRNSTEQSFFTGNRNSPWYVVAFGMIGASLSGVTFISVPGAVGTGNWGYFQLVLGYLLGYLIIGAVLLPLYYRLNLVSIYGYLGQRLGKVSYKTGAIFFIISRLAGSGLRLYLAALVLHLALFRHFGLSFELTVIASIGLIYLYTFKGGIRTVVWTDTFQTFALIATAALVIIIIMQALDLGMGETVSAIQTSPLSKVFVWDWKPGDNFFKQFISGALIALAMTGLDQDMMQKNLTCRSLKDAQKNMFWFSLTLVAVNLLFLSLGVMLYEFGLAKGFIQTNLADCALAIANPLTGAMECTTSDKLFPTLALNYMGPLAGITFLIGVIAAAYSSADSTLTALTTSFCYDILGFGESKQNDAWRLRTRTFVHLGFAGVMALFIIIFHLFNNQAAISAVFTIAGYTYGPLLGLFFFGQLTQRPIRDKFSVLICILAPVLTYLIQNWTKTLGFDLGFMTLLVNGALTFGGLWLISSPKPAIPD